MTDRPVDVTEWASSGSTTAPSSTRQANGWVGGDVPPAEQVNYLYNLWTSWLGYLAGAGRHTALGDAADELDAGETAIIDEYDGDQVPGEVRALGASTGGPSPALNAVSTGRYLIVSTGGTSLGRLVAYNRDDITASPTNITISIGTASDSITDIATNGTTLVIARGDEVEAFTVGTWAKLWDYDHGAAVEAVAIDGTQVYLGGASGTGSRRVRAITISSGAAAWSIDHGADVTHLAVAGRRVFIGSTPSGYASGSNLRAVNRANGYDATGECAGGGTDTDNVAWNRILPYDVSALTTDGRHLYCGYDSVVAPSSVELRNIYGGGLLESIQLDSAAYVYSLDTDHEFLAVGTLEDPTGSANNGYAWLLNKATLAPIWRFRNEDSGHAAVYGVVTDGAGVFACLDHSTNTVQSLVRGNRPALFRRVAATDIGRGYGRLILAQEGR